ncbi:hypothetical protein QML37_31640, partial [Klebsiella pneumoniae]|uniref:hypothetical protein n=1 Tax=Klebsiella pneumoniae TaxID=573 RepID=UPI003A8017C9
VVFSAHSVTFQDLRTQTMIGEGFIEDGLHRIKFKIFVLNSHACFDSMLWHRKLGHCSSSALSQLLLELSFNCNACDICQYARMTKPSFTLSNSSSEKSFDLIHSDVWGPALVDSFEGYKYYIIFIDVFSKVTWIYFMKHKSEVFRLFTQFHAW